ncbi:hypothetical protein EN788_22275 [Mesorhizobium sp. M2D.F.Ca.ET.145.01.1.1]|uniref:hypothetical protein n=1 Tax=unclassified Mesorhizobium TaxID=325217 RepID=UPI000FCA371F|nr:MULTISPECIES: hypothetical protein [unclassified Mesorhizobium]TGU44645.1 hypothetical protein EN789_21825 [bacterium M00.F.Ca.ET.146.01.1.1]TGU58473.1 hypothetical protein EN791_021825 [Mesorhizobium sp. M2D.F.Ca.ET.148.01.1.1]TGU64405.1 hypothetical protein EN790_21820 [Mesorhizobium sp. M2D.F.Ca.ET.147.01.1.1]TGW09981.1 hypothetical protein EN788_22275 [Mesorhizobium sp. M2D.F.Ca.ET.145.01.1.1]
MEEKKTLFEMSIDTRMLYDRLKKAVTGEVISFTQMSEELGRPIAGDCSNLQSALHRLEGEGIAFANVRGSGYQRMNDIEVVNSAETAREGIRKKARRAIKRLTCVQKFDALPNELKVKHNAALSGFGAIASIMSPGRVKSLEEQVAKAGAQLPLAKTLEAFKI